MIMKTNSSLFIIILHILELLFIMKIKRTNCKRNCKYIKIRLRSNEQKLNEEP